MNNGLRVFCILVTEETGTGSEQPVDCRYRFGI